ncbi:hypothetical protein LG296_20620 (plasmid) [Ureibacillus chungkukjangi]|uniref:hypothetical protein n=1 Tax=Ureibacillus chungkukjangi TaxID=1202712 RepID=UPI000D33B08C|nr:hypothetical protein [Ureibacillus chungkukjangi]MCM3390444.1 hypothetical protein [Ureibacillus chungkukjangi]
MFIVSLLKNDSGIFATKTETANFHVPLNLIEFKAPGSSIDAVYSLAVKKLQKIINSMDDIDIVKSKHSMTFTFGNKLDGFSVTYKIRTISERSLN